MVEEGKVLDAARAYEQLAEAATLDTHKAEYYDKAAFHYLRIERPEDGLRLYQKNLEWPAGTRALDSLRARAHHQLGVYYLNDLSSGAVAYPHFLDARYLRKSIHPQGHQDLLLTERNLALYHLEYALTTDSARYYIQRAAQQAQQLEEVEPLVRLLTTVSQAKVYAKLDDPASTRLAARLLDQLVSEFGQDIDPVELAFAYYDLGTLFLQVGDCEEVYRYSRMAQEALQAEGYLEWVPNAQEQYAGALQLEGRYREAEALYREARQAFVDYDDIFSLHINHYNLGLMARDQQRYRLAEAELHHALDYAQLAEDTLSIAQYHHTLATVYLEQGRLPEAGRQFDQSIDLFLMADGSTHFDPLTISTELMMPVADLLGDRARYRAASDQTDAAIADMQSAFSLMDRVRAELPMAESQQYVSKRLKPLFMRGIALYYERYQAHADTADAWAAFQLSERAKAFSLGRQQALARRDRPVRERDLQARIARLERQADSKPKTAHLAAARLELSRLRQQIIEDLPLPEPLLPEAVSAYLQQHQLHLIEYATGPSAAYRFSITPDGQIEMHKLPAEHLGDDIDSLRQLLRTTAYAGVDLRPEHVQAYDAALKQLSYELGQQLIPHELLLSTGAILIVPDGVLGYLPFGALLTRSGNGAAYDRLPYLARSRSLSYSYSMAYLINQERRPVQTASRGILALAPNFGSRTDAPSPMRNPPAMAGLMPLLHNEEEVRSIADLFGSRADSYFAEQARRELFMEQAGNYRILHLSSHAVVNADRPGRSFVAFSQQGDSLEQEELLLLSDLAQLKLNARLAVLSACETGIGQLAEGEGVLSLARAFSMAGAESSLTTLWRVDDAATKEWMIAYYSALKDGQDRARALVQANEQSLASEFAHPFYWSGMSLYGPIDAIELGTDGAAGWMRWWWIAGLLLIGLVFWLSRRQS